MWRGGVGAIIILPIVLCRAGAIYLRANMIPISWQAGGPILCGLRKPLSFVRSAPFLPQAPTEGK